MYKLICGSIFEKKCDVIVIPCDNYGNVSYRIKDELISNNIPFFQDVTRAGNIQFYDIDGYANASIVGYAASVDIVSCDTLNYVKQICQKIVEFCEKYNVKSVNLPLLGAGAGGLTTVESFNTIKSFFANTQVTANIFAFSNIVYTALAKNEPSAIQYNPPRVFISYTAGDNISNKLWTEKLFRRLRDNGVDARMDEYFLNPGADLPQWMANEILLADKVLLICDKQYAEKSDFRKGGVGWETMIIQGDMMVNPIKNKYICIAREDKIDLGLPVFAKSKFSFRWSGEEIPEHEFKKLLSNLFDCQDSIIPEIKSPPDFILEQLNLKEQKKSEQLVAST